MARRPAASRATSTRDTVLAERLEVADSLWAKFMGLMGRPALPTRAGLWLPASNGIHMMFMRFPIDAVFLGGPMRPAARAGRAPCIRARARGPASCRSSAGADGVLELPVGTIARTGTGGRATWDRRDAGAARRPRSADPGGTRVRRRSRISGVSPAGHIGPWRRPARARRPRSWISRCPAACAGCGREGAAALRGLPAGCSTPGSRCRAGRRSGCRRGPPGAAAPARVVRAVRRAPSRRALHALKYAGERRLARRSAPAVARRWARAGAGGDLVVPVPVHATRRASAATTRPR